MDISTSAVQSYQRHEQPTVLTQQSEQALAVNDALSEDSTNFDLSVSISDKRTVYQWIAHTFDRQLDTSATISPIAQSLFDYGIIGVEEQKTINLLSENNESISLLNAIEGKLPNTDSYQEKSVLSGLYRIFSTLEAARTS